MRLDSSNNRFNIATDCLEMGQRLEDRFSRAFGETVNIEHFSIPRVFPHREGGFSIQYRFDLKRSSETTCRSMILCGHLVPEQSARPDWTETNRGDCIDFDDIGLYLPIFPFDPTLSARARLGEDVRDCDWFLDTLRILEHSPDENDSWTTTLLGYRLQRRCVLRYELDNGPSGENGRVRFIAKYMKPRPAERALKAHQVLKSSAFTAGGSGEFTIPDVYAKSEHGVLTMELLPGRSLHDLIGTSEFEDGCGVAGRILARLHKEVPAVEKNYSPADELAGLDDRVAQARTLFPRFSELWEAAYDKCRLRLNRKIRGYPLATIHGDFYDKQVMYTSDRAGLLDFDNVVSGDPARDVGNFLAHIYLRGLQKPDDKDILERGRTKFVSSYNMANSDFGSRVGWWQITTTLRLAAIYCLRPKWRHLTPTLLSKVVSAGQRPSQLLEI